MSYSPGESVSNACNFKDFVIFLATPINYRLFTVLHDLHTFTFKIYSDTSTLSDSIQYIKTDTIKNEYIDIFLVLSSVTFSSVFLISKEYFYGCCFMTLYLDQKKCRVAYLLSSLHNLGL